MATSSTRPVRCTVTGVAVGQAIVDSYDLKRERKSGRIYRVPLYRMRLVGYDDSGKLQIHDFKVVRFGVGHDGSGPDFIAGKSKHA